MALAKLASKNQKCVQSKIALVTPDLLTLDNLPDDLLRLAQMSFDAPFNQWLAIAYETAKAIRSPLYQHGTICLNDNLTYQFKRIIYPIMPANERASNHRILSAARLLDDLEAPII